MTESKSEKPRRKPVGSGRSGRIRSALRRAVQEARDAPGSAPFSLEDELRVLLADKYAALVDDASTAGDGVALLRASDKLLEVLDTLPVRKPEGGGAGDGFGGGGARQLHAVLDGPPQVGDSAHS